LVYGKGREEMHLAVLECSRCNELYYSAHGSTELSCAACGGGVWRVFNDEVSFARVSGLPRDLQPGDHAVLLYTEEHEAVEFCARFLQAGFERGERALIALPTALRSELIGRLGPGPIETAIVLESGRLYGTDFDPEATARELDGLIKTADGPVRVLAGPDGDSAEHIEPDTFRHYERIAHQLVLDLRAICLCVYDGRNLPIAFSPVAIEGHPLISRGGGEVCRNADFRYQAS
jgi:hypothetical protein